MSIEFIFWLAYMVAFVAIICAVDRMEPAS